MTSTAIDIARLHPVDQNFSMIGRIKSRKLKWAGQFVCAVETSVGDMFVHGNRDVLLNVEEGSWLVLRLHRHAGGVQVRAIEPGSPLLPTAWLPDTDCHRREHLQRLRHLLGQLTPAMQAFFIAALPDGTSHRRLFERVAAVDHHVYPGGLFDQSVEAAEHAFGCSQLSERNRGIAALAAMLFDIGKLADPKLGLDFSREGPGLAPHPLTRVRALRACDAVEPLDAELSATLRRLLTAYDGPDGTEHLRFVVHRAVARSWSTEPRLRLPREMR